MDSKNVLDQVVSVAGKIVDVDSKNVLDQVVSVAGKIVDNWMWTVGMSLIR